jgi:DNA-binding transcriptional regulator LsrR (DeoR family)
MKEELVRAAHYYYVEKLTQQEIAQKMAMSRQRVSRLLKRAEEEGVVEIRVHGYSESCAKLEDQLRKKLRLDVARIVNSDDDLTIGEVAMDYIENHVTPDAASAWPSGGRWRSSAGCSAGASPAALRSFSF